jgi:phage shock protein A
MASGAIDDMVSGPRDDIQLELDRMGASHDVDAELARLKGELGQGSAPRQIEAGANGADGAAPGTTAASDGQATPAAPPAQEQAGDGT